MTFTWAKLPPPPSPPQCDHMHINRQPHLLSPLHNSWCRTLSAEKTGPSGSAAAHCVINRLNWRWVVRLCFVDLLELFGMEPCACRLLYQAYVLQEQKLNRLTTSHHIHSLPIPQLSLRTCTYVLPTSTSWNRVAARLTAATYREGLPHINIPKHNLTA
jgi:hypothetical protein